MPRVNIDLEAAIGSRIRNARMMAGVSQEKLGETIGVTFQQIQKYESGRNRIAASTLIKVAEALKADASTLLHGGVPVYDVGRVDSVDLSVAKDMASIPGGQIKTALSGLIHACRREALK